MRRISLRAYTTSCKRQQYSHVSGVQDTTMKRILRDDFHQGIVSFEGACCASYCCRQRKVVTKKKADVKNGIVFATAGAVRHKHSQLLTA